MFYGCGETDQAREILFYFSIPRLMMKLHYPKFALILILLLILFARTGDGVAYAQPSPRFLTGWFSIIWGDSIEGLSQVTYKLTDESGQVATLLIDDAVLQSMGGVLSLDRKYVSLQGQDVLPLSPQDESPVLVVTSIKLATPPDETLRSDENPSLVSGAHPWVSILCKFSNVATEPKSLPYFQNMYSNAKPGLDHYWRETSYETANIAGSSAAGWFVLPHEESYYNPSGTLGGANLNTLAADCTAAADASVNFALYDGINMMFNTDFDKGYAWGGGHYLSLDGVSKVWRITWEPPWGYSSITVIAHEMGHGFGLPHSSGNYGEVYDNRWDVMSDGWTDCANSRDATYGCLGQHTIAYHKDRLGWIPVNQKYIAAQNSSLQISLEQLALPQTGNYKIAQIPIGGSNTHFYTVEVRRRTGYDIKLPAQAVIIHEVDTARAEPAHVIDIDNNGNTGDAGAQWLPGETFSDAGHGISVTVDSATASGFLVTINYTSLVPGSFTKTAPTDGAFAGLLRPSFSWQASSNASSYEICIDTSDNDQCNTSWVTGLTGTTYTPSGNLTLDTNYFWQVRAVNGHGTTLASVGWWSFNTRLATPSNLRVIGTTFNTATIAWEDVGNESGYKIYRWNGSAFTYYTSVGANITTFTDTNLTCNSSYWYEVSAYNNSMESIHANWVVATTAVCYTISGNAGVANATMSYTGGSVIADGNGNYTLQISPGWSGTVTPSKTGYTFTPVSLSYANLLSNQTGQNYAAHQMAYTFVDVPVTYWAWSYIEQLYAAGITGGCATNPQLLYCPENPVTRAQMAIFLEKSIHGSGYTPPTVTPSFGDTVGHWASNWIEALKKDGITSGCGNGNYCPDIPVTRGQMAVFLLKAKYGSGYAPPALGNGGTGFADVPTEYWAAAWIKQLAAEGVTSGCGSGNYCPDQSVTRAQMAVFLAKTFGLP
ncbi:MAG: hypothetical protein CVU44_22460 [Chloroflexi bacterium HGW-Chloroflexi-6]|nr:MAG: hypothetical protein CVU44_22460 [Chloroflexi bacterium HGW-Chloroflexi-6]